MGGGGVPGLRGEEGALIPGGGIWAEAMVVCTSGHGIAETTFIEHLLCTRPCAEGIHSLII